MEGQYVPGVCNIGPAERRRRRMSGYIGTIVTILAVYGLRHSAVELRLIVFLPATVAASGFLQDAMHFCAGFGMRGIYNLVGPVGDTKDVTTKQFHDQDRRKAQQILGLSIAIGAAVAILSLFV